MIGDRLDFDIQPAGSIGMKTIHVIPPADFPVLAQGTPYEIAFLKSMQRTRVSLLGPRTESERPNTRVRTLKEIPAAIEQLCDESGVR